jgi:hypothetical protein
VPASRGGLAHLIFIQIRNGLKGNRTITVQGAITQQKFGFVAGSHHQTAEVHRLIVKHNHARPCHDVPTSLIVRIREARKQWLDHFRDVDRIRWTAQRVNDGLCIGEAVF